MARTTKPLTNTEVKQAKPKAKEYNLADGQGLYLRAKPNGTKLWLYQYTKPFVRTRTNLSLGSYPALSLKDARKQAEQFNTLLAKDIDPKEERTRIDLESTQAHLNTFQVIADKWFLIKQSNVSATYAEKIKQGLDNHIFPEMGRVPIHKINAPQTIHFLEPIAEKGSMETISKLCRWVNEIMVYAVNTGVIHSNPLSGIRKAFKTIKPKNMPTIKPERLPELMEAINQASITLITKSLIEWQLHTMVRPAEAAGIRWEEIDLDARVWTIPPERMKTGKSHTVPLSSQAITILNTMRPISGHRDYVFPSSRKPNEAVNSQTANMALKRMGFKGTLVSHGLRALASTTLNEQQFDSDIIESALAHIDKNTIRAAYNRAEYLEQRRVMMQWWSDHIEQAEAGKTQSEKGFKHLRVAT
jgi:integrase